MDLTVKNESDLQYNLHQLKALEEALIKRKDFLRQAKFVEIEVNAMNSVIDELKEEIRKYVEQTQAML